jgi:hypothetical protein
MVVPIFIQIENSGAKLLAKYDDLAWNKQQVVLCYCMYTVFKQHHCSKQCGH